MSEAVAPLPGVPTWYAEHGGGDPLVYLHGGYSDSRELNAVLDRYTARFHVFTPDRRGQGRTADVAGPITYDLMAADTVAFLEQVVGGPAHLVGYSDGAITALLVALARPDLVRRLVLVSGQFRQDGLVPGSFDSPEVAEFIATGPLAAMYAEVSPDGPGHFGVVVEKLRHMQLTEPALEAAQLAGVRARTLVVSADDDAVTLEHTVAMYRAIPDSELAVVPGTSHVLVAEKPERVADLVLEFLTTDPVPTIMPLRRAR